MTNALLTILCVLTAADLALNAASVLLHRFAPKSKATADVDLIKKDVDEAESAVAKLAGKQSGKIHLTLVALIGLLAVIGCSALSCTAAQKKALGDFGTCEETAAVKDLEGPVKTVGEDYLAYAACVATGGSDCHGLTKEQAFAMLDSLAASYGLSTVGCAAALASQFFSAKVSGSADTQGAVDLYNEWLAGHGAK